MRLGIQLKFMGIVALATLTPLAVAVVAIQTMGYNRLVREKGSVFRAMATHVASTMQLIAAQEVGRLRDYAVLAELSQPVTDANAALSRISGADLEAQIRSLEGRWRELAPTDPGLLELLNNPTAQRLKRYHALHAPAVELLLTDRAGRLIAANHKTTDYWQADESWWQQTMKLGPDQAWLEGVHFDESARTFSLDIALPLAAAGGPAEGALKVVLDASPFFSMVPVAHPSPHTTVELVEANGAVLLRWRHGKLVPTDERLRPSVMARLTKGTAGWAVARGDGPTSLIGFAPLRMGEKHVGQTRGDGPSRMFVLAHEPADVALAPLRRQVTWVTLAGGVLVIGFGLLALWLVNRTVVTPVKWLREAAGCVAATVNRGANEPQSARQAQALLQCLDRIHTSDELEHLARDFRVMGQRVLHYQQELKEELDLKTATIQDDLDMARQFQESLMPRSYPPVPTGPATAPVVLHFNHIYLPAATLGGDFFDVMKFSDDQVGVLIADVMGHGTRSALVTAMLRALLQSHARHSPGPAELLALVNRHFHELVTQTSQMMFVTAFYMLADVARRTLTFASAGHPSPLVLRRAERSVEPLFEKPADNPALGLFPDSAYDSFSRALEPAETLVLFTDGVVEALNPAGEEFGEARLVRAVRAHIADDVAHLPQAINDALSAFVHPRAFLDDICLVTVDVRQRPPT